VKFALRFPFVADPEQQANNVALIQAVNTLGELEFIGTGSPNGVVTASPPARYWNRSGGAGTTLYVKESGVNTNTGWVGK
jgi:hypothetical protein